MSITTQLTHSAETWHYLRGLVSLYKPPGYPSYALVKMLKRRLAADLNCMRRSWESDTELLTEGSSYSGEIVKQSNSDLVVDGVQDYSNHPAVLGPGYQWDDIKTVIVNPIGEKASGVLLVGVNRVGMAQARTLRAAKLMRTYHVRGELGRATRTGWADGKTVKCEGWTQLAARPWMIQQMLANISSANQARAWNVAEVGLDTQEGYELALKGPPRPKLLSETIFYNIKLKEFKPPSFLLELHCVDGQSDPEQEEVVRLVQEVALKCKTVCHVHSVRCAALGPWSAASTLLPKQLSLQHVLNNISDNRKLYKKYLSNQKKMSSLTVLCPNGHRVKVVTNPNMSLQAVLETACSKKGFDSSGHILEFHRKRLDLSSSIRFSGIPNNATVEMSQLSEEEIQSQSQQDVSVCIQLPDGQRLMENFPSSTNLLSVMERFSNQLGEPGEEQEPVMVYMRKELVGRQELESVSLRTLGLIQGRGLFRFFYKKPEELKSQANVYEMKTQEKKSPAPAVPHVPMRVAPDNRVEIVEQPQPQSDLGSQDVEMKEETEEIKPSSQSVATERTDSQQEESKSEDLRPQTEDQRMQTCQTPDSTQPEPIINILAPHDAVVFSATEGNVKYQDIDDDFFELSLDEVKVMYRDLKHEVKKLSEGEALMTREMRENQREAEKLSKLSQYKSCVLRIQFPCRHVVQGIFPPETEISEVQSWLSSHLLASPETPHELFTAPPRTVLPPSSSLIDLGLFPAALIHFASLVTKAEPVQYLSSTSLASLSNLTGANMVASQARRRSTAVGQQASSASIDFRLGKRSVDSEVQKENYERKADSQPGAKVPKWFRPSKK